MVQQRWPEIVEAVKFKSRVAWVSIMNGVRPIGLVGNQLTLSFEAEGALKNFTAGNRDTVLREVLKERLGVDWRIEAVHGVAAPAPNAGRPASGGGFGGGAPAAGFAGASTPAPPPAPGPRPASPPQTPSAPPPAQPSQPAPQPSPGPSAPAQGPANQAAKPSAPRGAGDSASQDPGPLPPPPDEPPPPSEPGPPDDIDVVDPEGDADYDGTEVESGGMALIQRELGGQIIREIDNT